jgi:DNA-directed RNA polymerase specialized sigma24 family protein
MVTTKNEALRILRIHSGVIPVDPTDTRTNDQLIPRQATAGVDEDLLRAERRTAVLDGLAELPAHQRELLVLLVAEPPVSYDEISRQTGMPIGSIGPTRSRCLAKLRATASLRALLDTEYSSVSGGGSR